VSRPLLICEDGRLVEVVSGVAAACGLELAVEATVSPAGWRSAPLVLIGIDRVPAVLAARLPVRPGVAVLAPDPADDGIWQVAFGVGAREVLFLPSAAARLADRFGEALGGPATPATCVGVIGGRGGVGASTLATALAVTAARHGRATVLVDLDRFGGGLDLLFGGEDRDGFRWSDLAAVRGRPAPGQVRDRLPHFGELTVLSWSRTDGAAIPPAATAAVCDDLRTAADLVVVDLARPLDPAGELIIPQLAAVFLVVPADLRGVAAAGRVAARLGWHCADIRPVVRVPGPLAPADVVRALGLPAAGEFRTDPRIPAAAERGEPPGASGRSALTRLCTTLLAGAA
jgi:secretion/DNA translocation related CpaE-like protein